MNATGTTGAGPETVRMPEETYPVFKKGYGMEYKWPLMKKAITFGDKLALAKFILTNDRYSNGPKVKEFEKAWSDWLGVKYSIHVNSGSDANLLLISAMMERYNIVPGDKVLLQACTWNTTVSPVIQLGLRPVFCDINLTNYGYDVDKLVGIPEKERNQIKLVIVTHLIGFAANVSHLRALFPNAVIMEDCCESHGASGIHNGNIKLVGTMGEASTFSFFIGHHMTTIEGGMVSTNDEYLDQILRAKRSHGLLREMNKAYQTYWKLKNRKTSNTIDYRFFFAFDGFNCRGTELSAVLGLRQLKRLTNNICDRKANLAKFASMLREVQLFGTGHGMSYFFIPEQDGNSNFALPFMCYHKYIRDILKETLEEFGIENRVMCGGNITRHPFLISRKDITIATSLNNADKVHDRFLYIGNHPYISLVDFSLLKKALKKTIQKLQEKDTE